MAVRQWQQINHHLDEKLAFSARDCPTNIPSAASYHQHLRAAWSAGASPIHSGQARWPPDRQSAPPHGNGHRGLRFHDLWHSAISIQLAAGVDVLEVAGQAGHKDPSVTLRTYAHRMPSGRDRVRKIQSAAWAAGTQPTVIPLRPDDEAAA